MAQLDRRTDDANGDDALEIPHQTEIWVVTRRPVLRLPDDEHTGRGRALPDPGRLLGTPTNSHTRLS